MNNIFYKIAEMIEKKETKQIEVAKNLGITQSHLSQILRKKAEPSETLKKLAEILYGNGKTTHQDKTINAVIKLMEGMDKTTKESTFNSVQEKKQLQDLMKEKQNKEAA